MRAVFTSLIDGGSSPSFIYGCTGDSNFANWNWYDKTLSIPAGFYSLTTAVLTDRKSD